MQRDSIPLHDAAAAPLHPAYRRDIDGLRALAVLAVVLFHAFPSLIPGGFIGVDIFFVISGFLISSILLNGLRQQRFSFADFYARRVRRIFPALAIVMACCAAFGWIALFPDEYQKLGMHMVGGAGFVSNFFLWSEVGYFDTAAETKPLLHLWSLAVEEQFYIVWPVLLWLAFRRRWAPWKMAALFGVLSFAVNLAGVRHHASASFYSPASRMWELLLGATLAYMSVYRLSFVAGVRSADSAVPAQRMADLAGPRARRWASFGGLLLIVCGLALVTRDKHFPGGWALLPTLGALLLIAAGPAAWVNRVLLSNRLMVWFGLISYPLYLWHWPLLSFLHIVESGVPRVRFRIAAVLAAVLLAWLTYRLVERPLRRPGAGARKVGVLVTAMLALALGGGWIYRSEGLPQRPAIVQSAAMQKQLVLVEDVANAAACKKRYGFDSLYSYCLLDDVKRDPTVALVGDSHAYHIVAGLTRFYHERGENLWMLGTRWPFFGIPGGDDPYQQATGQMMDLALNTRSVHTVILSTALKLHTANDEGRAIVAALRDTLRRYTAAGKQVIWVNDVPMLDFEPRACIRRAGVASSQTRTDCSIPRAQFDQNVAGHLAAVAPLLKEFPQVQVFDAAAALCDAQRCHAVIDGHLLYRDTHHLSYEGDLLVGQAFARQFGGAAAAK